MARKSTTKALSLDQLRNLISQAFYDAIGPNNPGWVEETYADYLIANVDGAYLKVPFSLDTDGNVVISDRSEWREVERAWLVKMLKRKAKQGGFLIHKQADGDYRWVGVVTNHFRDRDNPPEILSAKAHKAFVKWADKSKQYPELWFWHVPGSKVGQADWLEYANGFLLASGLFDKDKTDVAEALAASKETFTMSHGFMRLAFDRKETVTDGYWMYEASITPKGVEANEWTSFRAIGKEGTQMPISEKKKAFLAKYLPAETIKEIEGNVESLKKAAEEAGADWKEVEALVDDEPTKAPEATAEKIAETPSVKEIAEALVKELQLDALSEMLAEIKTKTEAIETLTAKMGELETTVKELKKSDDEKVAEAMTPKAVKALSWFRDAHVASTSEKTALKEGDPTDDALKAAQPSALERFIGNAKP